MTEAMALPLAVRLLLTLLAPRELVVMLPYNEDGASLVLEREVREKKDVPEVREFKPPVAASAP